MTNLYVGVRASVLYASFLIEKLSSKVNAGKNEIFEAHFVVFLLVGGLVHFTTTEILPDRLSLNSKVLGPYDSFIWTIIWQVQFTLLSCGICQKK